MKCVPAKCVCVVLLLVYLGTGAVSAAQIAVAAASDLTFVLTDIAARYEKQTGNSVRLAFGSSGNFFAQIENGAPFDVFFSADIQYPKQLAAGGLAGAPVVYGWGRLVLWVPAGSTLDVRRLGMKALSDPSVRRIAIANPAHAPYGRAAVAALRSYKLYDGLRDKLVLGENISQTLQFVQSGNAQVGILALALTSAPSLKDKGTYWEIPPTSYPSIEQAAVILTKSSNKKAAQEFLDYLRTPDAQAVLRSYGLLPSEAP